MMRQRILATLLHYANSSPPWMRREFYELKDRGHLRKILREVSDANPPNSVVSGGVDCGYRWELTEDESVTHESYMGSLDAYLEETER